MTFKFIYILLVKLHTFGFILKKYATAATDMYFSSQYVNTKACLTNAYLLNAVLTGVWCLEVKHNCRS
jgi:hypothetical protein